MKESGLLFCLLLLPLLLFCQFQEDFNDGSFLDGPVWMGDAGVFEVNLAGELHLKDTIAGMSFLSTGVLTADSTTWEFYVRQEFAPSASNFARVYLSTDQANLESGLNGYYLKIGGESGATDKIELFRQDGTNHISLLSATAGAVGGDPSLARVRVIRNDAGQWTLFADYTGGTNFTNEGTVNDGTHVSGGYIGVWCLYTATRSDKFFFDDFTVSPIFVDTQPPSISNLTVISGNSLDVLFDEALDQASAEMASNYSLSGGVSVISAMLDISNPALVHLELSPLLENGLEYILSVAQVADIALNAIPSGSPESAVFTFVDIQPAMPLDILINEFLPDPSPVIGLPNAEFIELFNRAPYGIQLANHQIRRQNLETGTVQTSTLPQKLISPGGYLILCRDMDVSLFEAFLPSQNVLGLSGFSNFLPNEDTARLTLLNDQGLELHSLNYHLGLYQGLIPDGRSLELVNPSAACLGEENIRPSTDLEGGTPAALNTVFDPGFGLSPPQLTGVQVLGEDQIRLIFDKSLVAPTAEMTSEYSLTGSGPAVQPIVAFYSALNRWVELSFTSPFQDGITYTISIGNGVRDCLDNSLLLPAEMEFHYIQTLPAERYDILINEIYADPTPSLGLPENEFVELYNRSTKTINLKNFVFADLSSQVALPDYTFGPGEYLILFNSTGASFESFGDFLAIPGFPGLGNEGEELSLINPAGEIIHALEYDRSWYRNSDKDDGGWSLELINPENYCEAGENWRASVALIGGTPGTSNSVLVSETDEKVPDLIKAFPVTDMEIRLFFSEALSESSTVPSNFLIEPSGNQPISALLEPPFFSSVLLELPNALEPGQIYSLNVNDIQDCRNNGIGMMNNVRFGLPEEPAAGELIINEILFNPLSGGVDFVELYNHSQKAFNLGDLILANRGFDGEISQTEPLTTDCLILPEEYFVITPDPSLIKQQYLTTNPNGFLENDLPSYPDSEGDVVLFAPGLVGNLILDEFHYSSIYQFELLDDLNGVSLERIRFSGESQDPNNWHSAAQSVGYATPAYRNSQFFAGSIPMENAFSLASATFSPDEDGFEDYLLLNYQLAQPGYVANIRVFDGRGREVRKLAENELLATEGLFQWDGLMEDGTKGRIGIYILFVELFDLQGNVSRIKKTAVLAGRL